jgi:hypothetical protein
MAARDKTRDGQEWGKSLVLLIMIGLFPLCFMWQGLDVTDTGYTVANMQQFLAGYPKDLPDAALGSCWLTYLIGAGWYKLAGGLGLMGFRVLYLLITFTVLGVTRLTIPRQTAPRLLAALFTSVALVISRSGYVPSYNEMTALFFILTAAGIYFGLMRGRRSLIFLAGIAGGASIFVRLPNLAIGGIIVAIIYFRGSQAMASERPWSATARLALVECLVFGVGYLTGVGAVVLLMAALGDLAGYGMMLRQITAMFGDSSQHHGGAPLLRGLLHDYFYAALAGLAFALIAYGLGRIITGANRMFRFILMAACAIGLTGALLAMKELDIFVWPAVIYTVLIAGALGLLNLDSQYRLLCMLAALVMFMTPLGSNNGIYNTIYAFHFAVPVALIALLRNSPSPVAGDVIRSLSPSGGTGKPIISRIKAASLRIDRPAIGWVLLCAMISFSVIQRWQFTYRDSTHRLELRAAVHHPRLRGIFTTPERAQSLDQLLAALQPLVHKNEFLMDHMQIPMLYFLTETKPYLYSTWANLYEPTIFKQMIDKALGARPSLPVCVMTKVDTCSPDWPKAADPLPQPPRFLENRRLVEAFLQTHNYRKHWENNGFEIWLPSSFMAALN